MTRPYVLLSVAVSIDGYIDDGNAQGYPLSNAADFECIDQVRAESSAILIGAETIRRDNPRLIVNSAERRTARIASGLGEHPLKVTVTGSGDLDPQSQFWHHGDRKLVYTTDTGKDTASARLGDLAEVVSLGPGISFGELLDDLAARGVDRLMVEGGGRIHTAFLAAGLADEIRMAVAPMLIGHPAAPRFLNPAEFPGGPARRFHLQGVEQVGDIAVLRYFPKQSVAG